MLTTKKLFLNLLLLTSSFFFLTDLSGKEWAFSSHFKGPDPTNGIAAISSGQISQQSLEPDLTNLTLGNYCFFLNQVAWDDPYGLYNEQMADGFEGGAIIRKGEPGNYNYHVVGNENLPISNVSYLDILRYCNWVENGGGTTFDNPQITEEGSYQIGVPQVERARVRAETEATRQQPLFQENPDSTFIVVDLDYPDQDLSKELALDPSNLYLTSNQPSRYLVVAREDLGALPQSMATRQAI